MADKDEGSLESVFISKKQVDDIVIFPITDKFTFIKVKDDLYEMKAKSKFKEYNFGFKRLAHRDRIQVWGCLGVKKVKNYSMRVVHLDFPAN